MPEHIKVTVHDPERVETFTKVFGSATVCVKSLATKTITTPDHDEIEAYMLDLDLITSEQLDSLIVHIAQRFGLLEDVVREMINAQGVPILQMNTTLAVTDLRFLI